MQKLNRANIENFARIEGKLADIHPELLLQDYLEKIGQAGNETGFFRRMLLQAGFDYGNNIGLDRNERIQYFEACNKLISAWNTFDVTPSCKAFEAALMDFQKGVC